MRHWVGVFIPLEPDGWRALFPDFPGCVAEGPSLEITMYRAADSLLEHARFETAEIYSSPMPRNTTANQLDENWAATHGFSLRKAIISMIPLRGNDNQRRGWNEKPQWGSWGIHKTTFEAEIPGTAPERGGHRAGLEVCGEGEDVGETERNEAREGKTAGSRGIETTCGNPFERRENVAG